MLESKKLTEQQNTAGRSTRREMANPEFITSTFDGQGGRREGNRPSSGADRIKKS
jgi:hypothetical protein